MYICILIGNRTSEHIKIMKNFLFLFLFVAMLVSCKSPQDKILSSVDNYIINNFVPKLKDPKSYEPIKSTIIDTLTNHQFIEHTISRMELLSELNRSPLDTNKIDVNNPPKNEYTTKLLQLKEQLKTSDNNIACIKVKHEFRAKNGFGALDVSEIYVTYMVNTGEFEISEYPTSGLDPAAKEHVKDSIDKILSLDELNTIIMSTHDIEFSVRMADSIYIIGHPENDTVSTIIQHYDLKQMGLAWTEFNQNHMQLIKEIKDIVIKS